MKYIKLFESFEGMELLNSVNLFLDTKTLMLYPNNGGKPDENKGMSIDDMENSWFDKLSDVDFGTVDNYLNKRTMS